MELSDKVIELDTENFVQIRMNYKAHLASQYVTNKICEEVGTSLEVGFLYGGTVRKEQDHQYQKTTINLDSFHLPTTQELTPVTFDISANQIYTVQQELTKKQKRITGVGHSHGTLPVFHSGRDHSNYTMMSLSDGIKVTPTKNQKAIWIIKQFGNLAKKVLRKEKNPTKYIMPTLVYNTRGELATGIAVHNGTYAHSENIQIEYYNKKQELTDDEKKLLDRKIRLILKNLQTKKPHKTKQVKSK